MACVAGKSWANFPAISGNKLYEIIIPPSNIDGIKILKTGRFGAKLELDTGHHSVDQVIQSLMSDRSVVDINVADPPLEEIIREIYLTEKTHAPV